jgi:hypothetical protein
LELNHYITAESVVACQHAADWSGTSHYCKKNSLLPGCLIHYFVRMLRQMSQSSLATSQSADDDGWADNWLTRRSEMLLLMNEMTNCYYYGNLCINYMVAS